MNVIAESASLAGVFKIMDTTQKWISDLMSIHHILAINQK